MKCPTCGSVQFYAKDPLDEYEEHPFTLQGDEVMPQSADALEIIRQGEVFCERCAWHGRLAQLNL